MTETPETRDDDGRVFDERSRQIHDLQRDLAERDRRLGAVAALADENRLHYFPDPHGGEDEAYIDPDELRAVLGPASGAVEGACATCCVICLRLGCNGECTSPTPVAGHEQEVRAEDVEHADKHSLWTALDALNEAGQEPTIAGVDAEGRAFLAYLAEEGGDATYPGVVFDEPHQTAYGMHGDQDCGECGCPRRRWTLDDLKYPIRTLAARSSGSSAPVQGDE